ncbi:MAG: hypothetical protein AAGI48_03495 [Verrucomicrobiota bacterium]
MPQTGIATGLILILFGLVGYFAGGRASVTALIPAFFGLPILLTSLLALKKLKLGMHLAAVFGLLGFLAPLGRIIPTAAKGEFELNLATGSMIAMVIVCGIFMALCIRSFREARRAKAG